MANRRKIGFLLLAVVLASLLASTVLIAPAAPVGAKAGEWELVERGANYIRRHKVGTSIYSWESAPQWVWNGSAYVPYIFEDRLTTDGYIQVQSGLIGARIYQGYAMFYDPDMREVRLYQEQWEVQQLNPKNKKWIAVIGSYSTFEGYLAERDETCVNVTMMYSSWAGWLNVTYSFREGRPLKNTVVFKSALNYKTEFKVLQKWAGIAAEKVKHHRGKDTITAAKTVDSPWFRFEKADGSLSVFEDQGAMYYGVNEATGETYVKANECLKPVEIDVHAKGLKADFVFGNWALAAGESLVVDPDTATITPPLDDTWVDEQNPTDTHGGDSDILVRSFTDGDARSFLKFNVSNIPAGSDILLAKLRLYCYSTANLIDGVSDVEARRVVNDTWSETGISWNDQPAYGSVEDTQTPVTDSWIEWTVSDWVQNELDGDKIVSICLKSAVEGYDGALRQSIYRSKEYGSLEPELYVEYTMPPNTPTLVSPADGARYDPGVNVTFTWNYSDPDGDPQGAYRFQLDNNTSFSSPMIDTGKVTSSANSTTQTLPGLGTYYWRVMVWDDNGSESAWSSNRSILVGPEGPLISDVEATTPIRRNDPAWLNITIRHINGTAAIKNATITLEDITNQTITYTWTAAGDTYAEASDPDNIGLLGTNSTTITVNSTTLKLCFNITITAAAAGDLNATVTAYDTDDDPGTYNTLLNYEYYNWNTAVYDIINSAYEFFDPLNNYVDALGDIKDLVSSLSAYWLTSITNMITLVALQFTIVLNVINWLTRWLTRIVDMIVQIGGIIVSLFNGTAEVSNGIGNLWDYFEFDKWYNLATLIFIIKWVDSIIKRGKTQGGELRVFIDDINTVINILSYLTQLFTYVINTITDYTFRLFDAII